MTPNPAYSIWYVQEPDGSWTAKCMTWPGWRHNTPSLDHARVTSEPSLRAWIAENARITHYQTRRIHESQAA